MESPNFTFLYALNKKPARSLGFLRTHLIFYILGHVFHYFQDSLGGEAEGRLIYRKKQVQISDFISSQCKCNTEPVPWTCWLFRFRSQPLSLKAYQRKQEYLLENVSSYIYFLFHQPSPKHIIWSVRAVQHFVTDARSRIKKSHWIFKAEALFAMAFTTLYWNSWLLILEKSH